MEPIILPIEDVLDLHQFRPGEIPSLLTEYFAECRKAGIFSVRIIHGKGQGILKKMVLQQLKKNPAVLSFREAPVDAGGWGATIVELARNQHPVKEEKMEECDLISVCGFYLKFSDGRDPVIMGFIRKFCKGPDSSRCARKAYHHEHGQPPDDDMLPSGRFFRY